MFKPTYKVFNSDVACRTVQVTSNFVQETDSYEYLKNIAQPFGWKCIRIDTVGQQGFPDILMLRKNEYWLIESKRLKKKSLDVIEDDVVWQFGQLAFAKRALTLELNYMIVVVKHKTIAYIKGVHDAESIISYPDFVGQL